jgi:hypothetical protein
MMLNKLAVTLAIVAAAAVLFGIYFAMEVPNDLIGTSSAARIGMAATVRALIARPQLV